MSKEGKVVHPLQSDEFKQIYESGDPEQIQSFCQKHDVSTAAQRTLLILSGLAKEREKITVHNFKEIFDIIASKYNRL